jgi:thiol-disulfide isomerase/thioredoxin
MNKAGRIVLFALTAGLALTAAFWMNPSHRGGAPDSGNVAQLMAASLPDMDGKSQALAQWRGKVMVVNFWATWCLPCLEEIPEFVRMQERLGNRGLQFVGIAVDDVVKVREFAVKYRMNYPILIGEMDAIEFTRVAGNERRGLPFTIIMDRKGRLIGTELGGLNEQELTAIIQPVM